MMKAGMVNRETGELTLLLGITDENVSRLVNGEPIMINLNDLGLRLVKIDGDFGPTPEPSGRVLITQGRDEVALASAIGLNIRNPAPGDELRVRFDRKDRTGHGHDL